MYKYVNISENEYKKKERKSRRKADKGQSEVSYHNRHHSAKK
jgi:hypothetical protein